MNSREASNNTRRDARRAASNRDRRRSVGATNISAPQANALGMSRRANRRQYGRGETARRVEAARKNDASTRNDNIAARPAVYTGEAKKQSVFSRFRLPSIHVPEISFATMPVWAIAALAAAIVVAVVAGPARNYYIAWRDAGVLQAEYDALAVQNEELNHEIERLQTLEGIEDEARRRGYVYPDEEAVVVEDLEEEQVADPALIDAAVEEHERTLPWYVGILDAIFGYQRQ